MNRGGFYTAIASRSLNTKSNLNLNFSYLFVIFKYESTIIGMCWWNWALMCLNFEFENTQGLFNNFDLQLLIDLSPQKSGKAIFLCVTIGLCLSGFRSDHAHISGPVWKFSRNILSRVVSFVISLLVMWEVSSIDLKVFDTLAWIDIRWISRKKISIFDTSFWGKNTWYCSVLNIDKIIFDITFQSIEYRSIGEGGANPSPGQFRHPCFSQHPLRVYHCWTAKLIDLLKPSLHYKNNLILKYIAIYLN